MRGAAAWSRLALGLGLAIALAGVGQLALRQRATALGLVGYAAAIGLFIFTLRGIERSRPPRRAELKALRERAAVLVLLLASFSLLAFAVLRVNQRELSPVGDRLTLAAWLVSVAVFATAVLVGVQWHAPSLADVRVWVSTRRAELVAVAALAGLGLALRLYQVDTHPYPFTGDESSVGIEARKILNGEFTNLFETGWSSQPLWSFAPTALARLVFTDPIFSVRVVSVVEGALTIAAVYLLAREWFGRATGFLAAGFLVAFPFHLQFSRLGVNNVMDALLASVVLWLTFRAVRLGRVTSYLWAGLATGLTLYTYVGTRLVMALAVGTLAYVALRQRGFVRMYRWHLAAFAGAALVVAAPMAAFFIRHPDIFMARINQEGILQNGWLAHEVALSGRSVPAILLDQFAKSTLVFIARGAPSGFFNSPVPYLNTLAAIFFVLGLGYAAWRWLEPRCLTLFVWFWAVVILGSALTVNPPTSERLVMTIPPAAVLVALGLTRTAEALARLGLLPRPAGLLLCAFAVSVSNIQGGRFYYVDYQRKHYFADTNTELALESTRQLESLGSGNHLYLLGGPRVFVTFPIFDYLDPQAPKTDLNDVDLQTVAAVLPRSEGMFFVAIPERQMDLVSLSNLLPGGTWYSVERKTKSEVLYYAYQVPPQP